MRRAAGALALGAAGVLAGGAPQAAGAAARDVAPPFVLRVASPDPLYLGGRCRVTVVAEDSAGRPFDGIAWMTLSVDGDPPRPDGAPPFVWELDLGPGHARRRLTIEAVDRAGARSTLSVLSAERPWIERVGVELVLVPVVVREMMPDGSPGRVVEDLAADDFTLLEDGVPRRLASFAREAVPQSIVVALDTSASMERSLWSAQKAVTEFIRAQTPGSAVSLLVFNDQVFMEQDFTTAMDAVSAAVAALRVEGTRTALVDALRIGSAHLARRSGPRVLVLFTDGHETVHEGAEGRLRTAIEAAQGADVTVYAVAFGQAQLPPLREMTKATGGEVVAARSHRDMRGAFGRIAESLGARYVLGFEPSNPERGGYRKVDVVVGRSGVQVLAREGYQAGGNPR